MFNLLAIALLATSIAGCKLLLGDDRHKANDEADPYRSRTADRDQRGPGNRRDDERPSASAQAPTFPAHPRLLLGGVDAFARVKSTCNSDPVAREWLAKLSERSRKMVEAKSLPTFSKSMQGTARSAFTDITTLAGIYRLNGDTRCLERAKAEMLAIADFEDWQPKDFIVTGEMMSAMSIGYDWLFDALDAHDRLTIRRAIIAKGVRAGLNAYKTGEGWTTVRHNWNFVCNGSLILASLATAEDDWADANQMLRLANDSMSIAIKNFAPDGGWEEGPSYWNYATRYAVYGIAAMQTAGLREQASPYIHASGFDRTGLFRIAMESPTGRLFNFADCDEHTTQCPQLWWMARTFKQPAMATFEQQTVNAEPAMLDLLWYQPVEQDAVEQLPKCEVFRGVSVAALRSSWNDANASYLAIKGGYSEAHHGHLDLGSFVMDALGERWAIDLGADDYDLPGYGNGAERWTYYRCRTEGHNTLTINNANQELNGDARVIAFSDGSREMEESRRPRAEAQGLNSGLTPSSPYVVIDLTHAYPKATRVARGAMLVNDRDILIQDEFQFDARSTRINWAMHTRAKVEVHNDTATLTQNGKTLSARILSPAGARFEVAPALAAYPQAQQPDVRKLMIRLPSGDEKTTLAVLFSPDGPGYLPESRSKRAPPPDPHLKLIPLHSWIESAPIDGDAHVKERAR